MHALRTAASAARTATVSSVVGSSSSLTRSAATGPSPSTSTQATAPWTRSSALGLRAMSSSASAARWSASSLSRRSLAAPASASLLFASARQSLTRHQPIAVVAASASRSLYIWGFSNPSTAPSSAAAGAKAQAQQVADEAKQSLSSTATDSVPSSASDAASQLSSTASDLATQAQDGIVNTSEAISQLASTVAAGEALPHTATFAELGLGHSSWWPPLGWVQTFLDYMVETTGAPWWVVIIGTTITLRLALAPLFVYVQANTIRLGNVQPKLAALMADVQHGQAIGNTYAVQQAAQKAQLLFKENDCSPFRSILLPIVQMPIFVTFFFALRGMAAAGLPSLHNGGLGWFTDLAVADPYYILPFASTTLTLIVLETGAEMGTRTASMDQAKNWIRGIAVVGTLLVLDFPAAVLLYWVTNNTFSLIQLFILQNKWVRTRLNLPERIVHAPAKPVTLAAGAGGYRAAPVAAAPEQGFWAGLKQGMDSVKGLDAHTRSTTPTALRRGSTASMTEGTRQVLSGETSVTALARDRALRAMYEQSERAAPASASASRGAGHGGASSSTATTGRDTAAERAAAAAQERESRVQSARQRRAARRRI